MRNGGKISRGVGGGVQKMHYWFFKLLAIIHLFSKQHSPCDTTQRWTLFPFHFAEWPQFPSSANQIDRLTSISWSSRSEHLNVFWYNNEVWCRGVTKCSGSTIFPGPVLFVLADSLADQWKHTVLLLCETLSAQWRICFYTVAVCSRWLYALRFLLKRRIIWN